MSKIMYAGFGLVMGAAVGGIAAVIMYGLSANPTFFAFAGIGAAFGLLIGAALDMNAAKGKKPGELK